MTFHVKIAWFVILFIGGSPLQQKLKKIAFQLDDYQVNMALISITFILTGAYLFTQHDHNIRNVSILFGCLAILKGFFNFNGYSATYLVLKKEQQQCLFLLTGMSNILIGLVLIFSFFSSSLLLTSLTVAWFLSDLIPHWRLEAALYKNETHVYRLLLSGLALSVICSISLLIPALHAYFPVPILGAIYLVCRGVMIGYQCIRNKELT